MKPISRYADRETLLALKTQMEWYDVAATWARIPVLCWLTEYRRLRLICKAEPTEDNLEQRAIAQAQLIEANRRYHPILTELRRLRRELGSMRLQPKP